MAEGRRADESVASLGYLKGKPTVQAGAKPQPGPGLPAPTHRDVRYGPMILELQQ
jgi:hypothetical protein